MMTRNRMINKDVTESRTLARVSLGANLLFDRITIIADDDGLLVYDPRSIARKLFAERDDVTSDDVEGWLSELEEVDCVRVYEAEGGLYLAITNFYFYQQINRPTPSKLPHPAWDCKPDNGEKDRAKKVKYRVEKAASYPLTDDSRSTHGGLTTKRKEKKGIEEEPLGTSSSIPLVSSGESVDNSAAQPVDGRKGLMDRLLGRM